VTRDEATALVRRLSAFFPPAVPDVTISAYSERLVRFRHSTVVDIVERWIDNENHFPAWSELRKLVMRMPRSLSEQASQTSSIVREIESADSPEKARAVLDRHEKTSGSSKENRETVRTSVSES
jgi:hypothetical protein